MLTIRPAEESDLEAITEIYNEAILTTTATFDLEPKSLEDRRDWLNSHDERHPVLVADVDGSVVGWVCLTEWSPRQAYANTAETSFYVKEEHRGKGIGKQLKQKIIDEGRRLGFHTLIAGTAEGSNASMHVNEQFGFQRVASFREVGCKFGRLLDVHYYQLMLSNNDNDAK